MGKVFRHVSTYIYTWATLRNSKERGGIRRSAFAGFQWGEGGGAYRAFSFSKTDCVTSDLKYNTLPDQPERKIQACASKLSIIHRNDFDDR